MIRRGDHFDQELELERLSRPEPAGDRRKVTGWKYVRGSHGETFIRDPDGRDVPPRTFA